MMRKIVVALSCALLASGGLTTGSSPALAEAENGGCVDQDFKTHVSGGEYCLAITTWKSKETFDGPVSLVVAIHGDEGPRTFERRIASLLSDEPNFSSANTVFVLLYRPGYEGTNGKSGGSTPAPNRGRTTYTPDVFESILDATHRLAAHYSAEKIVGIGFSSGAAVWASALGTFPDKVPANLKEVELLACPCNVQKWEFLHGWSNAGYVSTSPHSVAHKTPKHVFVNAITAENDTNTYKTLAEEYVGIIQNAGGQAKFVQASQGGHNEVIFSPEARAILRNAISGGGRSSQ